MLAEVRLFQAFTFLLYLILSFYIIQVPHMLLTKVPKVEGSSIGGQKKRERKLSGGPELLKCFLSVHNYCVSANLGATPRRYIAFLNTYRSVYSHKKHEIELRQQHLQVRFVKVLVKDYS